MSYREFNLDSRVTIALAIVIGFVLGIFTSVMLVNLGNYSNLISASIGAGVALLVPIWQTYFVNRSKLALEVNGISRKVSEKSKISLDEHSELSYLRKMKVDDHPRFIFVDGEPERKTQERSVTLEELEKLLDRARQDLRDFPERIADRKTDLEKISGFTTDTFTKHECNKLNRPLHPEVEFNSDDVQGTIEQFKQHFEDNLIKVKEKYDELQSSLPEIERKVKQITDELIANNSYFEISATLINSGRLNTSIKRPALFRVYIGKENYIDLKLTLSDFESKSEIAPNSTVVGTFSSSDISQLPEEDRKLINTYWGQSVQCKLFVEDVQGKATASNSIAFSEGLYQKIIFDRLAVVATQQNM